MPFFDRIYSFYNGVFSDNALDNSKRSSFIQKNILEKIYPTRIILPMKQHFGEPAVPTVKVGEHVLIGQCVGYPRKGSFSSPVHSGISGTVTDIKDITLPDGTTCKAIYISSDSKRTRHPSVFPRNDVNVSGTSVMGIVSDAGIVGMGGEGIPSIAKIIRAKKYNVNELLVGCLQSEPYANSDFFRITDSAEYLVMGAVALAGAMDIKRISFLISEKHMRESSALQNAMKMTAHRYSGYSFEIKMFKERYPQDNYRMVGKALYGCDIKENETLEETCGAVLFNCSTVYACWEAISDNMPLVNRVVTVTDISGVTHNVEAPIGTPVSEILNTINGVSETNNTIIWGNCFTGILLSNPDDTPIIKTTSGITVVANKDYIKAPCIHCGKCESNCPMDLNPSLLYFLISRNEKDDAVKYRAKECFSCGCCTYVCPSGINLSRTIAAFAQSFRSSFNEGTVSTESIDIGTVSLLENYEYEEPVVVEEDDDSFTLPFEGGKKVK